MVESLGSVASLVSSPWIYVLVTGSVLLDIFLPVLPSGVLVIAAATAAAAGSGAAAAAGSGAAAAGRVPEDVPDILVLTLCATTASVLGDLAVYRLAWRGGPRLNRAIARSRRLTTAQERLGGALARGGGALVVLARFAPAGRSVVSLVAGAAHRRVREFLPWSALAGLAWAAYSVALGYFGSQWLGASWLATGVSLAALFGAGAAAAYLMRRQPRQAEAA
ncbi:DedA family protein [Streptomyces rochei]|uniref:DedA family protein n=1 Tax=Streptomyces rochei TaxID=1928 RepID=UPI003D90DBDD